MSDAPRRRLSVIVPTYNRHTALGECVRGLAAQTLARSEFQVLVVNDGGEPVPASFFKQWERELDLRFLMQGHQGQSAARNFGASRAEYEWLAFVDDDCVPAPEWLERLSDTFRSEPEAVLGGQTRNALRENVYAEASQALMLFLYEYYHRSKGTYAQVAYFTSNNLALAHHTFNTVGGFDETMLFSEDRDLCARLVSAGYRLVAVPAARVMHYRALDFSSFWRQHQAYGSGAFHYYRNRQRTGVADFRVEPFRFYAGMLRYPLRYAPHDAPRLAALIVVAQLANAFGFFKALGRARRQAMPRDVRNPL